MSNAELLEYLQHSRQERRELLQKAEDYISPSHSIGLSLPLSKNSEFPIPSPQRLMEFKNNVLIDLQKIFKPEPRFKRKERNCSEIANYQQLPVLRSLSKEDNYKKIYLGKHFSSKSKNSKPSKHSMTLESKIGLLCVPKYQNKERYLVPLLSKYHKKPLNI